uniref:Uncharacterized protein n=2 Tax=Arion vulgaris TaxID=1028688 RepID=A0A0B6YUK9_9EUPU
MPYRNACLDVVVCDAPFNQNHLFALTPQMFYYKFLTEIYRVLVPQGRCVLLTSEQLKHTVLLMVEGAEENQTQKDNFQSEGATSQTLVKGSKTHKDCYEARMLLCH